MHKISHVWMIVLRGPLRTGQSGRWIKDMFGTQRLPLQSATLALANSQLLFFAEASNPLTQYTATKQMNNARDAFGGVACLKLKEKKASAVEENEDDEMRLLAFPSLSFMTNAEALARHASSIRLEAMSRHKWHRLTANCRRSFFN